MPAENINLRSVTLPRMAANEKPVRPEYSQETLFLDSDGKLKSMSGMTGLVEDVFENGGGGGGGGSPLDLNNVTFGDPVFSAISIARNAEFPEETMVDIYWPTIHYPRIDMGLEGLVLHMGSFDMGLFGVGTTSGSYNWAINYDGAAMLGSLSLGGDVTANSVGFNMALSGAAGPFLSVVPEYGGLETVSIEGTSFYDGNLTTVGSISAWGVNANALQLSTYGANSIGDSWDTGFLGINYSGDLLLGNSSGVAAKVVSISSLDALLASNGWRTSVDIGVSGFSFGVDDAVFVGDFYYAGVGGTGIALGNGYVDGKIELFAAERDQNGDPNYGGTPSHVGTISSRSGSFIGRGYVGSTEKGLLLKSPNGHYWKQSISNTGVPTWADLGTSPVLDTL